MPEQDSNLSPREAYLAMYAFLDDLYDKTHSDYLGALLGSMCFVKDNQTADPAIWHQWVRAMEKARNDAVDARFQSNAQGSG